MPCGAGGVECADVECWEDEQCGEMHDGCAVGLCTTEVEGKEKNGGEKITFGCLKYFGYT